MIRKLFFPSVLQRLLYVTLKQTLLQAIISLKKECQIRFFVYPFSLRLYDTDVDSLEFINGSDRTISISCFGQEMTLAPGDSGKIVNSGKKFRHSSEQ